MSSQRTRRGGLFSLITDSNPQVEDMNSYLGKVYRGRRRGDSYYHVRITTEMGRKSGLAALGLTRSSCSWYMEAGHGQAAGRSDALHGGSLTTAR